MTAGSVSAAGRLGFHRLRRRGDDESMMHADGEESKRGSCDGMAKGGCDEMRLGSGDRLTE